ncbi:MAG: hypothetical protein LBQ12_12815 [Deltaproteobacteria bacterium]|nr:hypothetical protein [Deltaproteobacteria bacterium]
MENERTATCPVCGAVLGAAPGEAAFPCPVCGNIISPALLDEAGLAEAAASVRRKAEGACLLLGAFLAATGAAALLSPRTGVPADLADFALACLFPLAFVLAAGKVFIRRLPPLPSVLFGMTASAAAGLVLAAFEFRLPNLAAWMAFFAAAGAFVLTVPYSRATGKSPVSGSVQIVTVALAGVFSAALTVVFGAGGAVPWIVAAFGFAGAVAAADTVALRAKAGSGVPDGAWRSYCFFFFGATVAVPLLMAFCVRMFVRAFLQGFRSSGGKGRVRLKGIDGAGGAKGGRVADGGRRRMGGGAR